VRVVNVLDLMRLEPETEHPHGMSDAEYEALFTTGYASTAAAVPDWWEIIAGERGRRPG
jgi:phosphoketolase